MVAREAVQEEAVQTIEETLMLEEVVRSSRSLREARNKWAAIIEKRYLETLLQELNGVVSYVARAAGINRIHCYKLLWKHGLLLRRKDRVKK